MSRSARFHYAWIVLAVGTLIVTGALGLARFGYSLVLPAMQGGLGMDNTGAGALATVNLIGYLALSLLGGALASRFGPRLVASLGMTTTAIGMFATGTANSLWSAMFWRGLTGLGSGASNVPVMGLMSAWFGPRLRGMAAGVAVAGSSIALIIAGPLVPRILARFPESGWRVTWYIFGGAALLLALLGALFLRNEPREVGLAPLGGEANPVLPSPRTASLQWGRVYRSPAVWHMGAVYAAFGFSYIIYMTFFVRYLTGEVGYTRQAAGNLFMVMGWFSLGCGLIWGSLSDLIGRKAALVLVYAIHAAAFSLFALWPQSPGLTISAILFGLTAWSIPAIMAAACGDVLGPRLAPAALGFVTLFFGIGQAIGPFVAGRMADGSGSFSGAFLLAAAVAVLGGIGAWRLRPVVAQAKTLPVEPAGKPAR
jgi:MFS family permease